LEGKVRKLLKKIGERVKEIEDVEGKIEGRVKNESY